MNSESTEITTFTVAYNGDNWSFWRDGDEIPEGWTVWSSGLSWEDAHDAINGVSMPGVPFTWETVGESTRYQFGNGVRLTTGVNGCGYVVFPPVGDVASIGFPVKCAGDVFHALRRGAVCAAALPIHCRAW